MEFFEPSSVDEAVALLAAHEGARCLAGGATLVAMMNARLAEIDTLVSLQRVQDLQGIVLQADGWLRVGAMTCHRMTAEETLLTGGRAVLAETAGRIANATVRNMGTIGGSIAFADPAADYPAALVAADARIEIAGSDGRRTIAADDFFIDWYATALEAGEMVTAVLLPPTIGQVPVEEAAGVYDKLSRVEGDYAIASLAVVLSSEGDRCHAIRIAVGACGPKPVRLVEAEALLSGCTFSETAIKEAGEMLAEASDPVDDVRATAEYRRRVIPRMLGAAIDRARAKLTPQ